AVTIWIRERGRPGARSRDGWALWRPAQPSPPFFRPLALRLKRIQQPRPFLVRHFDGFPFKKVGGVPPLVLAFAHQPAAGAASRVGRRLGAGLSDAGRRPIAV